MSTEGSELELALEDTNFYDFLNIKVIHCQLLIVVGWAPSSFGQVTMNTCTHEMK